MVLAALYRGKHVFAAANFAADIVAAREMRDAARAAGTVCMLDSTLGVIPAHREMARQIAAGAIGRPVSASARFQIGLFNGPDPIGAHWRWFGMKRHGASAMRNLGTHSLHCLVELLGPIEAVTAQEVYAQREWRFPDGSSQVPDVADTAQLLLRFTAGTIATVELGWANPALVGWHLQVNGERGTMGADAPGAWFPSSHTLRLCGGWDAAPLDSIDIPLGPEPVAPPGAPPQATDIARLLETFVAAIADGGADAQPDFDRAFHVEEALEAARVAIAERRWVSLDEFA